MTTIVDGVIGTDKLGAATIPTERIDGLLAQGTIGGSIPLAAAMGAINANAISGGKVEPTNATRIWWAMLAERRRAESLHGVQRLPLGTGHPEDKAAAALARAECDLLAANEAVTWAAIIREEVLEAFAEEEPGAFVVEAIQAMGTLFAAIEDTLAQNPDLTIPPPF